MERYAGDPKRPLLNLRLTGDPAVHEPAIREVWGGALCLSRARHTAAELRALQERAQKEIEGVYSAWADERAGHVDLDFSVTPTPAERAPEQARGSNLRSALAGAVEVAMGVRAPVPETPPETDEGDTSRVSLRVPDHLKSRIEKAAGREGPSVNAWLVRAVSAALEPGDGGRRFDRSGDPSSGRHYTGWVLQVTVPVNNGAVSLTNALARLAAEGVTVRDAGLRRPTLDDVFLTLTGHEAAENVKEHSR